MKRTKRIIQTTLLFISMLFAAKNAGAQAISPHFFGQNAWMPDTIGNASACTDPPCVLYGKLHHQWANVKNSGASLIRYGGIAVDKNIPTNYQYIRMIDSIRANGMEPIIQVPFRNYRYNEQQAADIVKFINVTSGKNIKYWVIGNEPDLGYSYTNASQIAAYIKPFASAMKNVDPSIFIIGPECAWFNQSIMTDLTTPNGPYDITGKDAYGHYYVDYISFHTYPFSGSQTRAQVISKLTSAGSLQDNLVYLNSRISSCNTAHGRNGSSALKTAITEANIDWQNSATDNLYGVGASSFIGGQFWAEMMGIAMKNGVDFINFWSVAEGNNTAANIGYVDAATNTRKPSYYHYQMMAQNFKGNYVNGTTNQVNVKSFGSQNSQQTAVLVLNEDLASNYNCTIRLNTAAIAGTSQLKINVNANIATEYTDVIPSQATVLFIFNSSGALIKKYEYSLSQNAVANIGPTYTQFNGTTGVEPIKSPTHESKYFEIAKVFPNPNTGKFTIQLNKENTDELKYEIEVFNMEGQLALTKSDAAFLKGKEEVDLSIGSIAAGVYIVRVRLGEDMKTTKVVMVK
ncbi:MAG: T9SS type A sorting domain-containing protein [Bacteroidia bacterium]